MSYLSIKQDWMERQIEDMGRTLAAILFGKERLQRVFEDFKENEETNSNQKMEEMILDVYINSYLKSGELIKAEKLIFSFIENKKTLKGLTVALSFYNKLLESNDQYLQTNGFSKDKIETGMEKLKVLYEN